MILERMPYDRRTFLFLWKKQEYARLYWLIFAKHLESVWNIRGSQAICCSFSMTNRDAILLWAINSVYGSKDLIDKLARARRWSVFYLYWKTTTNFRWCRDDATLHYPTIKNRSGCDITIPYNETKQALWVSVKSEGQIKRIGQNVTLHYSATILRETEI